MTTTGQNLCKLFAVFLLLFLQACTEGDSSSESERVGQDEKQDAQEIQDKKIAAILSGPVGEAQTLAAQSVFKEMYTSSNAKLSYAPVSVSLTKELGDVMAMNSSGPSEGLVFHYAMPGSLDSIHYIISKGAQSAEENTFTWEAFGSNSQSSYYLLLRGGNGAGGVDSIDHDTFCALTANYLKGIRLKSPTNHVPSNHPRMVYHQGDQLHQFLKDNEDSTPARLHLIHGVAEMIKDTPPDFAHVPYLVFGNADGRLLLDDAGDDRSDYKNRSLDLGHPCPPFCKKKAEPYPGCP